MHGYYSKKDIIKLLILHGVQQKLTSLCRVFQKPLSSEYQMLSWVELSSVVQLDTLYTAGNKKHQNTFVHKFSKCSQIMIEIGVQYVG